MGTVLRRLRIENLVLIREAELDFDGGLNAITGETGAGKTILSNAIGLLLGARGDAAAIGPDSAEAYVEAELDLPDDDALGALAELRPDGEDTLRGLAQRLRHVSELAAGVAAAAGSLAPDEGEGAADLVAHAVRAVAPLEELAPELVTAGARLRDAELSLRDTASELHAFLA